MLHNWKISEFSYRLFSIQLIILLNQRSNVAVSLSSTSLKKVAVVTGSNRGIGYSIVKGLCENFPGDVFLTSRDESRGLEAVKSLNLFGYHPKFHQLDITNDESIINFKNFLVREYGGLDVLVNNAAISFKANSFEPFAIQAKDTIRVNYFGTRKVCEILFPILRSHARVVNLSSIFGKLCRIPSESLRKRLSAASTIDQLDELMNEFVKLAEYDIDAQLHWGNRSYTVSKVGISALTSIQQRDFLQDPSRVDIVVNSVHPGYVRTDIASNRGTFTCDQGAKSPLYAALLPENIIEPKGAFIMDNKTAIDWTAPC